MFGSSQSARARAQQVEDQLEETRRAAAAAAVQAAIDAQIAKRRQAAELLEKERAAARQRLIDEQVRIAYKNCTMPVPFVL